MSHNRQETMELEGFRRIVTRIHSPDLCVGACVIHAPSDGAHRKWPLLYRADRNIFERLCEHSVGHPDPDQYEYWDFINTAFENVHGCDGCCAVFDKEVV